MTKVKNFLLFLVCIIVFITIYLYREPIYDKFKSILNIHPDIVILPSNQYTKDYEYISFKQVDDYVPYSFEDLENIYYSVLNQGWDEFTFYCPIEYESCLSDVAKLSYNEVLLSDINNYVHPYNSYTNIKTLYDERGTVTIKITHLYSDNEIDKIDKDIDSIIKNYISNDMSTKEKIRAFHDYVINNTKYDTDRADTGYSSYDSSRINGVLYDHYAICSGYADIMAVYLNKLGIPNFKVSSDTHVWNVVYIDNTWLHIDLTWDDPVTVSGRDVLDHTYFLVNNTTLKEKSIGSTEHDFDKSIYKELDY